MWHHSLHLATCNLQRAHLLAVVVVIALVISIISDGKQTPTVSQLYRLSSITASSTLSPSAPSQLCSSKSGLFCTSQAFLVKPTRTQMIKKETHKGMRVTCQATSIPADRVPNMGKRELMNLLLLGAISLPTGFMLVPYAAFFVPAGGSGAGGELLPKMQLEMMSLLLNGLRLMALGTEP
ncbi:hypothetical protein CRYUN_Cryun10bG0076000 [Craigia yunnanensis]